MLSSAEIKYCKLIERIRLRGIEKSPTKGKTLSVVGHTLTITPTIIPLLQGRRIYWKGIVGEMKAFIENENTVAGFEKHGCNFWGAWANKDGSLDVDYARLLHNFNGVDQLTKIVNGLRYNPDSRKHVISLWDPSSEALQVPCVLSYQWFVDGPILNMIWTQRSVDVMIGLASDMFSAWLLNKIIAEEVGLKPGYVSMHLGDCHIYQDHLPFVDTYIDNVWDDTTIDRPFATYSGVLHDFEIAINDYNPVEPIKFELKS